MSVYLALQAAFFFSTAHILIRRGLVTSNAVTGTTVSIVVTAVVLWVLTPFLIPLSSFATPAVWYFVAAGVFAPAVGRFFTFMGIEKVGVARSVPVSNTAPLFSSIMAVVIVGEHWTLQNILGTSCVVLGIVILSRSQTGQARWRKIDLIYPVLAALSFALSSNLRKLGLLVANLPLMAAAVSATTALVVGLIMQQAQGGWRGFTLSRKSLGWFLGAGAAHTAAMLSAFNALSVGKIVIVDPLVGANPMISVLLTTIFLRDLEAVTPRVVAGAVTTVIGSILIMTV